MEIVEVEMTAQKRQHAVQSPQHRKRQKNAPVLGLLVVASEQVGDGSDERREVDVGHLRRDRLGEQFGPGRDERSVFLQD